jgi:ParB/RepB/Spo0J family partition protein
MTAAKNEATVREIPVEQLFVSLEETRKTIDQGALKELADSIAKSGVIEALLVRSQASAPWSIITDGARKDGTGFEIVAGQRRWLASKLAEKATCPCIVRDISDEDARTQRTISNLQREDLSPIEQAEAYGKLLDSPGATIETVAAKLAKSPSYVGRRIQLLKAIEPVREALKAGAIDVGQALELARLSEQQQSSLLGWLDVGYDCPDPSEDDDDEDQADERGVCKFCGCCEGDACDLDGAFCSWANDEQTVCSNPDCLAQWRFEQGTGGAVAIKWQPARFTLSQLKSAITSRTLKVLSNAPFPLDDELPPMACMECPKRSGNAALLFDDCTQDTCTDRPCFDVKAKVWVKHELQLADSDKRKLLTLSDGYHGGADVIDHNVVVVPDQNPVVPCEHQEDAIWINGEKAGHRTMICRDAKCQQHRRQSYSSVTNSDPVKAKADRKKLQDKLNVEKKYRAALFRAVAIAPINPLYSTDLNLEVCLYAIGRAPGQYSAKVAEALGWPTEIFSWSGSSQLRERLEKLAPVERLRVALVAAHSGELGVNEYSLTGKPGDLEKLAQLLGLDPKKIRAGVEGKPEATPAKTLEAKPAKSRALTPEAKKRIVAAAKKRVAATKKASVKPAKKAAKKPAKKVIKKTAGKAGKADGS